MALYILAVFLAVLTVAALILHYGFATAGALPDPAEAKIVTHRDFFAVDYTLFLNAAFGIISVVFIAWKAASTGIDTSGGDALSERILFFLSLLALLWIGGGMLAPAFV
jgi:hypothetical protein